MSTAGATAKNAPAAGIDALPDEALQHVLSFLPMREALRTCVLAQRWRHLWRSMPTVRISSFDFAGQDPSALNRVVGNFLLLRDGNAPLDLCDFTIRLEDCTVDEPLISSWIQQALLCRTQILRVDYEDYWYSETLKIRNLPLISQHLTTLELNNVSVQDDLSGLLALKNLQMTGCDVVSENISSQSLKQLTMIRCQFLSPNRVQISAPSVVWLELTIIIRLLCFRACHHWWRHLSDFGTLMIFVVKKNLGTHVIIRAARTVLIIAMQLRIVCFSRVYQRLKAWSWLLLELILICLFSKRT